MKRDYGLFYFQPKGVINPMPELKSQEEKSPSHIAAQPKDMTKNTVQLIMAYDLCGWKMGAIANELGITQGRVSVIVGSPLYKAEKSRRFEEMKAQVTEKKSDIIAKGDPVTEVFKAEALIMAQKKIALAKDAKSEFVQNSAASECLAYAGYVPQQKKNTISVLVTEKIADRFTRVLGMKIETTEGGN